MIEIYRYKQYINKVTDYKDLRDWIISNVRNDSETGNIPINTSLEKCMDIARRGHYTFVFDTDDRITAIIKKAKIEDVASKLIPIKKRGNNFTYDCPLCEKSSVGIISPKNQTYKCFFCGRTGNVIDFVMDICKVSMNEAINYLETMYKRK